MSKFKRVLLVVLSLVVLVSSVFSVSVFAYEGVRLPVSKNIPSATAVIQRTGGITQTPSAFAGNPYSTQYIYTAGNADTSVKLVVYTDDYYTDSSHIWTGDKSLHYVFTSSSAFDFNIDFGNVPSRLYDEFLPDDLSNGDFPSTMAISVKCGIADSLNAQGLPKNLQEGEIIDTQVFVNTHTSLGNYYSSPEIYSASEYQHIPYYMSEAMEAINSVTGTVDFDNGNLYNFVDVRINIQPHGDNYGHFIPGITSCDLLNTKYLEALATYSAGNGYDSGYVDGSYDGFEEGYGVGYDEGYDYGFDDGVIDGSENAIEEMGIFAVFTKSIDSLMDFPIFDLPNGDTISLGLLFGVIVGAMAFVWLLKLIAGG